MTATPSSTSLTVSWDMEESSNATAFNISYSNTNTDCFMDWRTISDIAGNETIYTLTGLEEGTEYSITVTATITEVRTQQGTITVTTMAAG